jgi:hypothetical protein
MSDTDNVWRLRKDVNDALASAPPPNSVVAALDNLAIYAASYRDALTTRGFSRTEAFSLVMQYLDTLYENMFSSQSEKKL